MMDPVILNIGKISIWFGKVPVVKASFVPRSGYFDGGSYWKFSCYWLKYILEFSGFKKDTAKYKKVSKNELDKILKTLK